MKANELSSAADREAAKRAEARNRAATYRHRNTAQLDRNDFNASADWETEQFLNGQWPEEDECHTT